MGTGASRPEAKGHVVPLDAGGDEDVLSAGDVGARTALLTMLDFRSPGLRDTFLVF